MHSGLFSPQEIIPADRGAFEATIAFSAFGPVDVFRTRSAPTCIEHSKAHVARTEGARYYIMMPTLGTLRLFYRGRDVVLHAGDYALFDNTTPFRIAFAEANHTLSLQTTPEVMRSIVPTAEDACGVRIRAQQGLSGTVRAMFADLWTMAERGTNAELRPSIARSFLDVIAVSVAMELGCAADDSSIRHARRVQAKRYIEAHLQDAELGAPLVARSLQVSPRYLRQLFANQAEPVQQYILRRRLEECAARLAHPLWRHRSITEIAFSWGFASSAHFSRVFRARFGTTPTSYRAAWSTVAEQP